MDGGVHARMVLMSDLAKRTDGAVASGKVRILLYSDNRNTREKVRFGCGSTTHGRPIEWVEVATHAAVIDRVDNERFDLLILDGEAAKSGGMGLSRQIKHEVFHSPSIMLLVGRAADAWLATWSEADAAVAHPIDPFVVREAVDSFFAPAATTA